MQRTHFATKAAPLLIAFIRGASFTISWVVLFWTFTVMMWNFTPYEAIAPQFRPQTGWEITVHTFFEQAWLGQWMELFLCGALLAWFVYLYQSLATRPFLRAALMERFTIANLACVVAMTVGGVIVAFLPLQMAPPPGFGYTLKFIVKDLLVLAVYGFWLGQSRIVLSQQNHS